MRVLYVGPFGQKSGYGHACNDNIAALVAAGVDVRIFPILEFDTDEVPERFKHLVELVITPENTPFVGDDKRWPTHVIVHAIPHGLVDLLANAIEDLALDRSKFKAVAYTTWETNKFPDGIMEDVVRVFDRILFPCRWNKETYQKLFASAHDDGLRYWQGDDVYTKEKAGVVPHALSPEWWAAAKRNRQPGEGPFTFLWVGTWTERKNPIGVLQAYFSEFRAGENVLLKIVTPSFPPEDIASLARSSFFAELPEVSIVGKAGMRLSEEEMRQLYVDADCYVTLARGEGWGLGAFEAAAVGLPVICPDYGGFKDFISLGFYPLNCFERAAWTPETTSGNVMRVAGLEIRPVQVNAPNGVRIDQRWAEPDMGRAMMYMRKLYNLWKVPHYGVDAEFRERFSWSRVGEIFKKELEKA